MEMLAVLLCFLYYLCSLVRAMSPVSLVAAMIIRDEAVNLRSNLPLWAEFTDHFVFLVDKRTTDDSTAVISSVLSRKGRSYHAESFQFTGFGQARTRSLHLAWTTFPLASHVIICDPDWRPRLPTISLHHLNRDHLVFRFVVFDRSGLTTRRMDWMLLHRPGLAMRYHLHEVLDIGHYNFSLVPWVFDEIEQPGTWHSTVGHGNSMSTKRLEFDLSMLEKDLELYPHDPHTHYYLGITYQSYVSKLAQEGHWNLTLINRAKDYLLRRLRSSYEDEFVEERWTAMFSLAEMYSTLLVGIALHCLFPSFTLFLHAGRLHECEVLVSAVS